MAPRPEIGESNGSPTVRGIMAEALHPEEAGAPECARQILDERARVLAEPPPAEQPTGDTIDVIRFELAHERYAVEARYVREVVRLHAFTPVPRAAAFVLGISNIHGELLPLFDLRHFFELDTKGVTDLSRIIVVGDNRAEFGVLAHEVYPVSALPLQVILAASEVQFEVSRAYVRGVTTDALIVLDGHALLQEQALFLA
jgi:purine-binding chemotaxis protein CheW